MVIEYRYRCTIFIPVTPPPRVVPPPVVELDTTTTDTDLEVMEIGEY